MKQIKTIRSLVAAEFDNIVNEALKDGWRLKRRHVNMTDFGETFIAEMDKEDGSCDDCRHQGKNLMQEPCSKCSLYDKWESREDDTDDED